MYVLDDTIAAISTPLGEGGIGIVRMSGPRARAILERIFVPGRARKPCLTPNRLHYGHIVDPETGTVIDEVLVSFMPAPRTYTRQDVAEINCHGGIVPLRQTLELCLRLGARLARPGEFTLRAFLNGRIDLAQAEAVLDVVRAKTEASLRVAMEQLRGRLSREVRRVRARVVEVLAHLEACLDFPEDEIPPLDVGRALAEVEESLRKLLASADRGMIYRQGARATIVGRPNVGKSSLLNALLRFERAIVTPIPGTTRDTLEETVNLKGIPLVLVDTAGIAESQDPIERLGIERSRQALARSDLALMVVDGSEPLREEDWLIAQLVRDRPALLVINKIDLPQRADVSSFLPHLRRVRVSALTGEGLEDLEEALAEAILAGEVLTSEEPLVSNPRHKDAIRRALESVREARRSHERGMAEDFVTIDLRAAAHALGEITGETVTEDVVEAIFSNFCIGK